MPVKFALARIILFAPDVPKTVAFYQALFGLPVIGDADDADFVELDAGGCRLAVHRGAAAAGAGRTPKIVFRAQNIEDERERLIAKGVRVGGIMRADAFAFFDARDPAGNVFQISSRP